MIQTLEQQVYLSKLLGYDYTIQYKAGKNNVVADAQGHFFILSMPRFLFLDKLRKSLQDNSEFVSLLADVHANPATFPLYSIHNDLLLYDGKL